MELYGFARRVVYVIEHVPRILLVHVLLPNAYLPRQIRSIVSASTVIITFIFSLPKRICSTIKGGYRAQLSSSRISLPATSSTTTRIPVLMRVHNSSGDDELLTSVTLSIRKILLLLVCLLYSVGRVHGCVKDETSIGFLKRFLRIKKNNPNTNRNLYCTPSLLSLGIPPLCVCI